MKDYSEQIESLRKEITEAIIGLLHRHGLEEIGFPDPGTVLGAPDPVYVIFIDDDGYAYEGVVTKVSVTGKSLSMTARDDHEGCIYQTESEFDLSSRNPIWLNEILLATQELLEPGNESLKT